jgi:hypothetical protein
MKLLPEYTVCYLLSTVPVTVGMITVRLGVTKSRDSGGNLGLNDQPWSY